tara:strand:+ start:901 stop:1815 length:915 start_codon:yes stop_codon:yes gene_type:complete
MKRIAILGGSHFIGTHLLFALYRQGYHITVYNRNSRKPPVPFPNGIKLIIGDRNNPDDLTRLFQIEYDAVIDLSGYTPDHVLPIVTNYRSCIGHYIFCSTPLTYKLPAQIPYNEESPRTFEENTYGGDKALVEDILFIQYQDHQWPITILRPQGVFGPYDPWQAGFIYYRLIYSLPIFVFPESKYRINPLFVDDLISAFLSCIQNPISYGQAYGVAGDDILSNVEFIELCGEISSLQPNLSPIKTPDSYEKYEIGKSWFEFDNVADCSKIKSALDIKFTNVDNALKKTFSWLKDNPSYLENYSK